MIKNLLHGHVITFYESRVSFIVSSHWQKTRGDYRIKIAGRAIR